MFTWAGLGTFRFQTPTLSIDELSRSFKTRIDSNKVIGRRPIVHLLGPDDETITLQSHIFPLFGIGSPQQLASLRTVAETQEAMMFASLSGYVFGRWIVEEIGDKSTRFGSLGAEEIVVDISLRFDPGQTLSGAIF